MIDLKKIYLLRVPYLWQIRTLEEPIEDQYYDYPFYLSAYECPECGRSLYKSVIKYGCEVEFMSKDYFREFIPKRSIIVKRIFTCHHCMHYMFSYPGNNLNDFNSLSGDVVFKLECPNIESYEKFMEFFSMICITEGRRDSNEFGGIEIRSDNSILEPIK